MSKTKTEKRPAAQGEPSKAQWTWREMKKNKVAYVMIAPFMLLFFVFTVFPVLLSIVLSFTDFNLLEFPHFLGLNNYIRLFLDDDIFILACQNTLIFASITGPVSYLLSLLIAWFINELGPKLRSVVTLVFYAPSISGSVYLVWQTLFSSDSYGWVNGTLINLGIIDDAILWFKDADYVMPLCIVVALWTSLGTAFLSFIAGLQNVPRHLYEAGAVDGIKNRWQELWNITLPYMKPQLMFGAVLSITQSFGFGAIVDALCGFPSVEYAAHTIVHHLNDYGGQRYEMGYASAIAVILFVVMVGANLIIKKGLSKIGQ
ncbi:MAG: ABC transporter permease [Oscillospiraceae bacterium]|jgi:multiple sugar transport system permease protein|nr:MAG: ABC transporter permease [Oscillospiraceae bacterium]